MVARITAAAALMIVAGWSFTAWSLWRDHNRALQAKEQTGGDLANAFGVELALTFDALEHTFDAVRAALPIGPSGFGAFGDSVANALAAVGDPDATLIVFRPDGRPAVAHGSSDQQVPPPPAPTGDDTIGWNERRLLVTRWLRTDRGGPAVAAEVALDPAHLLRLSRQAGLNQRAEVLIATTDGTVGAAFGADGQPAASRETMQTGTIQAETIRPGTMQTLGGHYPASLRPGQTTTYLGIGPDGVERMITVKQLDRAPLQVAVVRDLRDILGYQHNRLRVFVTARVLMTVVIGGLAFLLASEVHRRTARETELAYEKSRLSRAEARIAADHERLAAADKDLQASRRDLDAANHIRAQFLAHMSHELRTPLHAIIGFAELIRDQAPPSPPSPPLATYANDIWSSGQHLLSLINNVLDIAKVDSGTVSLQEESVCVPTLMRDSLAAIRGQAAAQAITLEMDVPAHTVAVIGDRTRLLQILINLLSNAVKFTPKDGQVTFEAAVSQAGDLVFSIADTGIGMTEAEIDVALQPFGQVDNSAARRFQGTGLGLPIARRMAEVHGGELHLTSAKGVGTRVTVTLPEKRVRVDDPDSNEQKRNEMA